MKFVVMVYDFRFDDAWVHSAHDNRDAANVAAQSVHGAGLVAVVVAK